MVEKPLQILALLVALESPIAIEQAQLNPWHFLEQFGITPETLVENKTQHQLPAFDGEIGPGNEPDSIITITED